MKKSFIAPFLAAIAFSACGSVIPDKVWYPVNEPVKNPSPAQQQPAAAPKAEAAAPTPERTAKPAANDGATVVFGEQPEMATEPAANTPAENAPAQPAAAQPEPQTQTTEQRANPLAVYIPPPDVKAVPPPPVDAQPSPLGINAISRTFNTGYDAAWEKTLEVMLGGSLAVLDKSSGVIITEWINQISSGSAASTSLFSDGQRLVRYKYAVKLYDRGGRTEVTVVPYSQFTTGRVWLDGKPKKQISEHLMRLLVAKFEGK